MVGTNCLYSRVSKTRRNNRVTEVERQEEIGNKAEFENALPELEDSSTLDTSFIERLNLTLRQATPYLTEGQHVTRVVRNHWRTRLRWFGAATISLDPIEH